MAVQAIVFKVEESVTAGNTMIKKFFKDITGITAREEEARLAQLAEEARLEKEKTRKEAAAEKKRLKQEEKLTPKERANKKKEPWVDVIEFKVDNKNIMHGFFELDWNDYFIVKLKSEGYGVEGDPEEEIVGRWYRDICMYAAAQEGINVSQADSGYLNIRKLGNNRSEIG